MAETSARFGQDSDRSNETISLAEVLSAMSYALDMTSGAMPGHALRTCVLGMRLGQMLGLPQEQMEILYYALLLKDMGCSSNAEKMTSIADGDDRLLKRAAKLADWRRPWRADRRTVLTMWKLVKPHASPIERLIRLVAMAFAQKKNNKAMISLRCERGSKLVRMMQLSRDTAEAVYRLDEHWDGGGFPDGQIQKEIPIAARIASVAQTLDVFAGVDGCEEALRLLRRRSGMWFDPSVVDAADWLLRKRELWMECTPDVDPEETRKAVIALNPFRHDSVDEERMDGICEAFAEVIDGKSIMPFPHSSGVAEVAVALALELGLSKDRVRVVRRAALLHDLGKLAIANIILNVPRKLNEEEWIEVLEHPSVARGVLERVPGLSEVAALAGEHHERLDGCGYPLGLMAAEISLESRIVAMADCFTAMAEDRPHRDGMPVATIFEVLQQQVPEKLDAVCFEALVTVMERGETRLPQVAGMKAASVDGDGQAQWEFIPGAKAEQAGQTHARQLL